jgi:hypothetical protein
MHAHLLSAVVQLLCFTFEGTLAMLHTGPSVAACPLLRGLFCQHTAVSWLACLQEGVFRVNCVDCLDRTNVVQGLLGRHALEGLLAQLGVLSAGEELAAVLSQVSRAAAQKGIQNTLWMTA